MNIYTNTSILIFLLLLQILFCRFLENGNRYRAEIFNVYLTFNGLSSDISHFVLAQNFIISTCLRYVDIFQFLSIFSKIIIDTMLKFSA